MFSRRTDTTTPTETVKGPSLARGPAWIVGLVLSVFGLMMFFKAPGTPLSTAGFPDGAATGEMFLGFEVNAWTAWLTTAAGIFVLIGAAQHLAARAFSLIAGVALGLMAIVALIDGDVLGLAAANGPDILGWGIAGAVLLMTALLPRMRRERAVAVTEQDRTAERDRARIAQRDRGAAPDPVAEPIAEHEHHRIADSEPALRREHDPVADHAAMPADGDRERETQAPVAGGMRSEPMRRTYQGQPQPAQPQTEAELDAQAQVAKEQTRTR